MDALDIEKLFLRHPFADGRRAVEALADSPGLASLRGLALQVAGREVDADGEGILIAVGKALWDVLPQTADPHHHLCLVVDTSQVVWDKEGFSLIQYR